MKQRSNRLTWFLAIMVFVLAGLLAAQTAYLAVLHYRLYHSVAGAGTTFDELSRILTADIGELTGAPAAPSAGAPPSDPNAPQRESLLNQDVRSLLKPDKSPGELGGALQNLLGSREVQNIFANPQVRALLEDLDLGDGMADPQVPADLPPPAAAPAPGLDPAPEPFRPAFAFDETPTHYVVTAHLPGVADADVAVQVEGDLLSVSGRRHGTAFQEAFAFPGPVVQGSEETAFRDGILTVRMRKALA